MPATRREQGGMSCGIMMCDLCQTMSQSNAPPAPSSCQQSLVWTALEVELLKLVVVFLTNALRSRWCIFRRELVVSDSHTGLPLNGNCGFWK